MNRQEIYEWFEEHMGFTDDPGFAGKAPEHQAIIVTHEFSGALRRYYESALTPDPLDDKALKEVLRALYTEHFVPIDLPMNDIFERIVEGYGVSLLDAGCDAFAVAVRKRAFGS